MELHVCYFRKVAELAEATVFIRKHVRFILLENKGLNFAQNMVILRP